MTGPGEEPAGRVRLVMVRSPTPIWLVLATLALWAAPTLAQPTPAPAPSATATLAAATVATHSGFTEGPSLEGGDSVTADLAQDDQAVGSVLRFERAESFFQPWFDWKRRLNDRYGLKLQMSWQALYQATDQNTSPHVAAGGRGEIQGTWSLIGRDTPNVGMLSFRVENRHELGTDIVPTQLSGTFGASVPVGSGFSDFGTALSELAWRQSLLDGRVRLVAGKISATSWYNAHALSSPKRGFQNTALQSSLTKAAPGRGIGAGVAVRLSDHFVALAGMHDANGRTPDNPFDTIDEAEFFYSAEIRWVPSSWDRRRFDQVRFNVWYQNERKSAGTPASHGFTFLASWLFEDRFMPFVMGGVSDGDATVYEADFVAGIGIGFNTKHRAARDVLGFSAGWGRPGNGALQDQYTLETFYRFQLVERLALTPSLQYIIHPANSTKKNDVLVFGIRARITF